MRAFVFKKLTLKHQTAKRVRLAFEIDKNVDFEKLENYILSYEWVTSVRVNSSANSITTGHKGSATDDVIAKLAAISFEDIKAPNINAGFKEERLLPLASPLLALCATPLLPTSLKLPVSFLASYQNMLKGLSHIPKSGISSEVLESLAIMISLYRKDYFAANTTNFLLELSEHIEDNIARKSDSMLQSLLVPDIKEVWIEKDGAES